MKTIWEWIRQFTPWKRKEANMSELFRYLWSSEPLQSGTLFHTRDGVTKSVKVIDGKVQGD